MDILDQLAVALGFATLAGVNLYLTAFVAGIAIRFNLVALAPEFHELAVLGEWPVLAASGLLLVIELGADKLPWVDSLWDTFHTLIRPIGGALLAISAVGSTSAEYDAIIALVAGSASMVSHGFKASSRLLINNSPEPFSNAAVSTAEDVAVLGGLALMSIDPRITAVLCLVFPHDCGFHDAKNLASPQRILLAHRSKRLRATQEPSLGQPDATGRPRARRTSPELENDLVRPSCRR